MPRIPIINAQVGLPVVPIPRASPEAFGAGAFKEIGRFGEILQAAQEQQNNLTLKLEAAKLDNALRRIGIETEAEPDFSKRDKLFESNARRHLAETLDTLDNVQVKHRLASYFDIRFERERLDFFVSNQKAWAESRVGGLDQLEGEMIQQIPRLSEQEIRQKVAIFDAEVDNHTKGSFAARTSEWGSNKKQTFRHRVDLERGYTNLQRMAPEQFKAHMTADNYPSLTASERTALIHHNEADIKNREIVRRAQEKERRDTAENDLITKMLRNELTPTDIDRAGLSSDDRWKWHERLIDRKKKAAEGVDTYAKSDGATRARVLAGVLREPGKWSQDQILGLMGRGLSIAHTLQAISLLDQKTRKTERRGKYDRLEQTIDTVEGFRKGYKFIKEGYGEAITDRTATAEEKLRNDEAYNDILDSLMERAEAGEDAREALRDLMEPYFKLGVQTWGDWAMGFVPEFLKPEGKPTEEEQAREFLKRHGRVINKDTLKRTMEFLKNRPPAEY